MQLKIYVQEYMEKTKHIQKAFLNYLEDESNENETNFDDLIRYLKVSKIQENKLELQGILHLISEVSNYHQRTRIFINKIEKILQLFESEIKENFSNLQIFNIFKSNKRILLFLFESQIIIPNKAIFNVITNGKYKIRNYPEYFFTEYEKFFDEDLKNQIKAKNPDISNIEIYEQKRKKGENDDHLCQIIRNDSLDEFISYFKDKKLTTYVKVSHSIFETNPLLLKNRSLLIIEYCAFFGSIKIFKYLLFNKFDLPSKLWLFAIHSQNAELIHLIEENRILPNKESYIESIKCHHLDITNYIENKLNKYDLMLQYSQILPTFNIAAFCNHNYSINSDNEKHFFYNFCKYDYLVIVESFLKNTNFNVNCKMIYDRYFFNEVFNHFCFM
ncbi:hypothetical protein M9Y10_019373 [Tritrichomonas musculus]|uniref:DUF3447 domain-containing protein n=1 Tax=Tritrichomonas musculus TaxID=1915356 RepID=A0ABR2HKS1_9EUKA